MGKIEKKVPDNVAETHKEMFVVFCLSILICLMLSLNIVISKDFFRGNFPYELFMPPIAIVISIIAIGCICLLPFLEENKWIKSYYLLFFIATIYGLIVLKTVTFSTDRFIQPYTQTIFLSVVVALLSVLLVAMFVYTGLRKYVVKHWKSPIWSIFAMIILILAIFPAGLASLQTLLGEDSVIQLQIYPCDGENNPQSHFMNCTIERKFQGEHKLWDCAVSTNLHNISGRLDFHNEDNKERNYTTLNFTDSIRFISPLGTTTMGIVLTGNNTTGEAECYSGSRDHRFYSEEDAKERNEKLFIYMMGLLFFCIITIPHFVITLDDHIQKKLDQSRMKKKQK